MISAPAIGLVSLGCAKNLVDSQRLASALIARGYRVSESYAAADLVIVNTCGFIDAARDESYQAIAEALAQCELVIVCGCLGAERAALHKAFPKLRAVLGPARRAAVLREVARTLGEPPIEARQRVGAAGVRLTPRHYAYVKIAEGCSHHCTFCIIPNLRGPQVSRSPGAILHECEALVNDGVRELLIVAQDSSNYGSDLPQPHTLAALCSELASLGVWVRLHYVYPGPQADRVVELMAEGKILPYLDVPLQHASPRILRLMRRPYCLEQTLARLQSWRSICPGLAIRSTFITGFPGESEQDFALLLHFLKEARLDRVGCFAYSSVTGAQANALEGRVSPALAEERRARLMALQEEISGQKLQERIGREYTLIIDEVSDDHTAIARSALETPDADGIITLHQTSGLQPGAFVRARITGAGIHDLSAAIVLNPLQESIHFKARPAS